MPTYTGNNGSNTINGSSGNDIINGLGGNDHLYGRGGNDTVNAGSGNDYVEGNEGNDTLNGEDGNDQLLGGSGTDTLSGGNNDDDLWGGTGNDTLSGGSGNDDLYGEDDDDSLAGGTGSDRLWGGKGNDTLNGDADNDLLYGEDGNDVINGGTGNDTASGGAGNDTINGNDGDDDLFGGTGNDVLVGGIGHDELSGDDNDDSLSGGDGNDTLSGGNGNDSAGGGIGNDSISGGSGNDVLAGDDGDDNVAGGTGNDTITGGIGNDELSGEDNDDTISGGTGNDVISGGNGNDTLTGGGGIDVIDGGAGTDTAVYSGSFFDYSIYQLGPITGVVHNGPGGPGSGADGSDLLVWVERLQFSDLTINLVGNNGPIAFDDVAALTEDSVSYGSGAPGVLANDFDFDGDALTVTPGVFNGSYGTLTLNANGSYNYVLNANAQTLAQGQLAQDSFNYTVSDGSASDVGALVFSITGLNDAPVANPDAAGAGENQTILINVLANDTDVDAGAVLTVTSASSPSGQGSASVVGNQVQFAPGSDFDHLAVGATQVVVVSYAIADQFGATSASTVSVTVTGTNDGPVANPDTAGTTENAVVTVNVLANDTDVDDGAVLTVTSASAPSGQGSASVVGNQVQFNPGSDFDHLAQGATAAVVVSYSIQDQFGATSSSTLTITVTGTNDGPVANPDADTTSESAVVTVDVLANDTDVDDGAVLTVTGASAPSGQGSASVVGNQVEFDPGSDFDHLAVGDSQVVVVSYSIADEHGATSASTVTITVTGTNDGPVANADTDTTSENAVLTVDVLANDTDADDGAVLTVTGASAPSGQGSASVVGNQVEFDPGSDFDYLAVGESAVVNVSYSIADDQGATSSSTVAITVTGTNDAPTIDAGGTDDSGSVTELPNGDPNENAFTHSDSGAIAFDDLDLSDTHSASFTAGGGGYVGTFSLDPVDQGGDTVQWNFEVDDSAIDFLDEGETLTQTYTVEVDDGNGGTVTQDVTVTITGEADNLPPDGTNWYIDNSAVGSLNTGSPTDPFTSIAAFNAAQGTPGGPGAGDNVFLLAGTGTYAEADGINLLDGQTLTGVADGPTRPTIVAAAGDGVNVAQNNNVSGFDIGSTSGAGIADSGGNVGTLTVSDVGKSGSGQIADIDQGGTLAVTLNSAASTGSTGGAIDLNGVGGSFTVSGATTITGSHTGGGVDVTGSSATVSLTGGGSISTGTAIAVNFTGNSGALSLDGGLDITTTTTRGINATGGGTITADAGSVTSTTGTAINISGTTIGGAGATFESVTTTGAASGIVLANTGAGGFSVTGTGAAGSGGTITSSTGAAVSLTNTGPVSFTDFAITAGGDDGIRGSGVNGLSLVRTSVSANGDASGEHGLDMTQLTGIVHIIDSSFTGTASDNIHITNTSGQLDLTMTGSTVGSSLGALANDGLIIEANGSASVRASITDSIFVNNRGDHFQFLTDNAASGTSHVIFADNSLSSTLPGVAGGGVAISNGGSSDLFFALENNSIQGANSSAVAVSLSAGSTASAEQHGTISGNQIGTTGVANSGSATGNGINATLNGAGTMTLLVEDNDILNWSQIGINLLARDGAGRLNATVDDNTVQQPGTFGLNSIRVEAGAISSDAAQIWLELNDNISDTVLAQDIRIRPRFNADILIPGYGGAANDTIAVDAYLTAKNPLGGDIVPLFNANAGSGFFDTPGSVPVPLPTYPDTPFF